MKVLKVFGNFFSYIWWIIFLLSSLQSFITILTLIAGVKYVGRDCLFALITFSLSIGGFGYLFRKTLFKGNNFIKLILIVLVILFGVYVWPTPYKYMPSVDFYGQVTPFKIHRITGKGYIWRNGIWWEINKK